MFLERADPGGEQAGLGSKKTALWLPAAGISTAPDLPLERLCSLAARQEQIEQIDLRIGKPLRSTLTFLQANSSAGDEKKPGLPPLLPSWNTVRWMTYDDGEYQLEFFLAEARTVLLRPTASSLRWRYF